jgi:hypothetical protein
MCPPAPVPIPQLRCANQSRVVSLRTAAAIFMSAVNSSGNEGPRSEVVVAEVLAKAVA